MNRGSGDAQSSRIESIDLVRGLVMALMLLDHMRDFLHRDGLTGDPSNPATTVPLLFLTRWVTHFCAPTFVFLAGVSARIQVLRGASRGRVARFLLTRGLFLVVLELVVIRPLIWFRFDLSFLAQLQVIWVTGWSIVVLSALIRLPLGALALFALVLVGGHNLLDSFRVGWPATSPGSALWALLHQRTAIQFGADGPLAIVQYPLIPWVAVLILGYVGGGVYAFEHERRRRLLARTGLGLVLLFLLLRASNLYGDPEPWTTQAVPWRTLASFLATEKYPPSLLYLCMTLGPALLALAWLERQRAEALTRPLIAIGRVPLFFYVLQWPLVHLMAWLFQWIAGQPIGWERVNPLTLVALPEGCGFSLEVVYLGWVLGLIALYPLCLRYGAYKRRHRELVWLSYL